MACKVLIVDDSAIVRKVLSQELAKDPEIQVVGTAMDPLDASEKIESLNPDVLTLDLEMPKMDGLTFLRSLMRHHPMPVVVVSAYTPKGSKLAMEALDSGAVEIVPKPGMSMHITEMTVELVAKIKGASQARMRKVPPRTPATQPATGGATPPHRREFSPGGPNAPLNVLAPLVRSPSPDRIIAIGSSTGGTQALQYLLMRLPANMPPILIAQHMPAGFTTTFADRLNQISQLTVKEAVHHDSVTPGTVLVAPGGKHMELRKTGSRYWVELNEGPKVCRQRPSVEVLFDSVAKHAGKNAIGCILTGMGNDGAQGMLHMREAGSVNIAEDEKSCVVFGMPKEAIAAGAAHHIVHLHQIPEKLHALALS